jgi:flagellar protein FliL
MAMADQKDSATEAETAENQQPRKSGKLSGKKLVMFIILPLLLLIGGGSAAGWILFHGDEPGSEELALEGESGAQAPDTEPDPDHPSIFVELPEITVNLVSDSKRTPFLRTTLVLDLESEEDQAIIESVMPRVVDATQAYLRSLRVEDLQGADGVQHLRDELLTRARQAAKPSNIRDILFKQMLVQQ